jgi:hypothetical protein
MSDEELIPWNALKGQSTTGLRRIALILMAPMVDQDENLTDKYAWGKAGLSIGREIIGYCDYADGLKKKKEVSLEKKNQKKQSDPRNAQAKGVIERFDEICRKEMGAPPANLNWGYALKQTYALLSDGWDAEMLKELVPLFFACRVDKGWIFRSGSYPHFISGVLNLKAIHDEQQPTIQRPASLA